MTFKNTRFRILVSTIAVVVVVGGGFYGKTYPYRPERWTAPSPRAGSVSSAGRHFANGSTTLTFLEEREEKDSEAKERKGGRPDAERAPEVLNVSVSTVTLSPPTTGVAVQQTQSTRSCTSAYTVVAGLRLQALEKRRVFVVDELNSTNVLHLLSTLSEMRRRGIIGNVTDEGSVLIYNKVGKCGSRALLRLITSLTERNRMAIVGSTYSSGAAHLRTSAISAVTRLVQQLPPLTVYQRHIHFLKINLTSSSSPRLLYFNMLRHPFERVVSSYYFHRFGDNGKVGPRGKFEPDTRNETFDECVQHRRNECTDERKLWYVVPYFCGQSRYCRRPSRWALIRAKQHIDNKYVFVGLAEYFYETIQAMEKLLPKMFAGARESWEMNSAVRCRAELTRTRKKQVPLASSRRFVLSRMKLELEFYTFVKDRFLSTLQRLEIPVTSRQA